MATANPTTEKDLFDKLNIDYEKAYGHNPLKIACIKEAISTLRPGSRVLDVGCGTGIPVSQMLADAGMNVTGIDVAPNMVELAQQRVKGAFTTADMTEYKPSDKFTAIFMICSHIGLSYAAIHGLAFKFAGALQPGGILVIGQCPSDMYVEENDPAYHDTKSFVEDFNFQFFGEALPTLMFSRKGQLDFLCSMGLVIEYDDVGQFQPDHPNCSPEHQQYVIARRPDGQPLLQPQPSPQEGN